jgi:hypothetical protein
MSEAMTLYRPVGQRELDLIAATGYRAFPPRLPDQPIFYPVLHAEYWIPAEDLDDFNKNIVGLIEIIAEYR